MIAQADGTDVALRVGDLAREANISTQQIRNYLNEGLLPPAGRRPSGYRVFHHEHVMALHAMRAMASCFGWAVTAAVMRALHAGDITGALAMIDASHAESHAERQHLAATLRTFEELVGTTPDGGMATTPALLRIGQVAARIDVKPSALRVWEAQGLLRPRRHHVTGDRTYDASDLRDAQTVALLRRGGYRRAAVADVLVALRRDGNPERARAALSRRQEDLVARSEQRLAASAALAPYVALLRERAAGEHPSTEPGAGEA